MNVLSTFLNGRLFVPSSWSREVKRSVGIRPLVRPGTRTGSAMTVLVGTIICLLSIEVTAQAPSFAGKEFRRVWVGGSLPQGAPEIPRFSSGSKVYLNSAGIVVEHRLWGNGIYFVDDSGAYTCAVKAQPEFSDAAWFDFMGSKPDGSFIICPVDNLLTYPCQIYNGSGLSAVSSPIPEQRINLGNYFDGRMVYLEHLGLGNVNIGYYSEGNPTEIWLDNSDFADLAGILDYDGESLAFATGTTGDFDIRLRASDGTLTRIIGNGDAMPGAAGTTYTGTPDHDNVEIDQGKVYVKGVGSGGDIVLFSSDGTTPNVIAKVGQVVPGLAAVTILGLELRQVSDGKIWVQVTQSDGETVLYQITGSTWARVIGKFDNFVRGTPAAFDTYEHGSLGDTVVIAVTYLDFSSPTIYSIDLYTNADLPGFSASSTGAILEIIPQLGGGFTIATMGDAGTTNTLQTITSLTNTFWVSVGAPQIADGTNLMEWTVSPTNTAGFFRLLQ